MKYLLLALLLTSCGYQHPQYFSQLQSLTDEYYTGSKYYLGWGLAAGRDPANMHNEVKYDVLHTHNIFVDEVGGNYQGVKLIGGSEATSTNIRKQWQDVKSKMTENDMFVQYSSGHGHRTGLAVGVSYNEMRDTVLSYPGRELIVFTMACNSGGLVNAFNAKKDVWGDWADQGRTLFVMTSSTVDRNSATGPGRDPDEPGGPHGSAGSAFGHALWKALIGYADGYSDGVKDGFLDLQEIIDYTMVRTQQIGRHSPVYTGTYNGMLLMNRVPDKKFLASLENSTENLSDDEIMLLIEQLDRDWGLE
jgi:hypothetical protein